jgi:hypothetical protein
MSQSTALVIIPVASIKFDAVRRRRYLKEYTKNGRKGLSAKAAGVSINTIIDHRNRNPDFAQAEEEALEAHLDRIYEKIIKHGIDGYDVPLTFQGRLTGDWITKIDNSVLLTLAKAKLSEFKNHHSIEQTTTIKGEIVHRHVTDVKAMTNDDRENLRMFLNATAPKEDMETIEPVKDE